MASSATRDYANPIESSNARESRASARVAMNTDLEPAALETGAKGKRRASMAPPDDEPRSSKRKGSKPDEKAGAAPRKSKSKASKAADDNAVVSEQPGPPPRKRPNGRSAGVTPFWKTNSSIAGKAALAPSNKKDFMSSGMYCQDPDPHSPRKLVNRVLSRRAAEIKAARKRGRPAVADDDGERPVFPPMPYDYGDTHFFDQEHDFVLPYDIQWAAENGTLDSQKRPDPYQRIRQNAFSERAKVGSNVKALCRCTTESGCDDSCDNRIMHYTCGKDCPAGDACNNKSLWKRKQPALKVGFAGPRGFGLFAAEDIKEGDFVIDYRGEVIAMSTFYDRCNAAYAASKNYYALAYDQDEVIDAGSRGNEARFINHGCQPNLEVRKLSTLGDGVEEFEVGMWASRDISSGEELCYDYNFDSFAAATATECKCGGDHCVGYLGRNPGEKSARESALESELNEMSRQAMKKQVKRAVTSATKKASVKGKPKVKAGKGESRETAAALERNKRVKQRQLRELRDQRAAELDATTPVGPEPAAEVALKPAKSRGGRKPRRKDETILSPEEEEARKEELRRKRISGWAEWLKKKASEKTRTREEWQDFANKRRRGKAWMEGMMQEYGVAEYDGGPALPYVSAMLTDIPPTLQPKRRGPPPGVPRAPRKPKPEAPAPSRVFDPAVDVEPEPDPNGNPDAEPTASTETDAERALLSIYPDLALAAEMGEASGAAELDPAAANPAEYDPSAVDFETMAVEELFGPTSVDYYETQQRYGMGQSSARANGNQLSQQSNARTETSPIAQPYSLAQIQQAVEAQAEEAIEHLATEEQTEELRQRAIAIVSSIQPQVPSPI